MEGKQNQDPSSHPSHNTDGDGLTESSHEHSHEDDHSHEVGKSELMMETELIDLIENSNQMEQRGRYPEAIELLEKALAMTDFKGGLEKKIKELQDKMNTPIPPQKTEEEALQELAFDLDKELAELSEEASQEMDASQILPPSTPPPEE